jgi:hypothetical protein
MIDETFVEAKRKLVRLMSPKELQATAVRFLEEGGEREEAKALAICELEYGEIERCRGTVYEVNVTLRCNRQLVEKLKPARGNSGWEEDPPLKVRLVESLRASLPSGYNVGDVEARAKMAVSRVEATAGPEWDALSFEHFSDAESLAKVGRGIVGELIGPFTASLEQAGLRLPDQKLSDSEYFQELSRVLRADRLPQELRAGVEEFLKKARLIAAEYRKQAEEDFTKRHYLFPLVRKSTGRSLLLAVAGCCGIHQDYPERLTAEQSDIVASILDWVRDYGDCHDDTEPGDLMKYEREVSEKLDGLHRLGLAVFAGSYTARMACGDGKSMAWPITVVLVVPVGDARIKRDADGNQYINGAIPKRLSQHAGVEISPAPEPAVRDRPGDATKAQTEELKAEMRKVLAEAMKHSVAAQPPINQGEAERIFAVLQRLRSKRSGMKAPLYDVFVATVLEGRSQRAAARSCDCSPALLSRRVGELEKEFGLPLKQLQNYAKPLLEMETSVKGQRYARKKRGAPQDETGQYEEDDTQAAREDDDGYLREERQDDS